MRVNELDRRKQLEQTLGTSLNDGQWKVLCDLESFGRMTVGEGTYQQWLLDCIATLEAFGVPIQIQHATPETRTDIQWHPDEDASRAQIDFVRSSLIAGAVEAEQSERIQPWREWALERDEQTVIDHLDRLAQSEFFGGEMPLSEELEKLRNLWLALPDPLPDSAKVEEDDPLLNWSAFYRAIERNAAGVLPIYLPGEKTVYHVAYYSKESPLQHLHDLAMQLAARFMWNEAEASAFILFRHIPDVPSSQAYWIPNQELPALSRIVLVLDPTLSPDEVREIYRNERKKYSRYPLRISHKHLFATYVAFMHGTLPDWPEAFRRHRQEIASMPPEMAFTNSKSFQRDVKKGMQKLLRPVFGRGDES